MTAVAGPRLTIRRRSSVNERGDQRRPGSIDGGTLRMAAVASEAAGRMQ